LPSLQNSKDSKDSKDSNDESGTLITSLTALERHALGTSASFATAATIPLDFTRATDTTQQRAENTEKMQNKEQTDTETDHMEEKLPIQANTTDRPNDKNESKDLNIPELSAGEQQGTPEETPEETPEGKQEGAQRGGADEDEEEDVLVTWVLASGKKHKQAMERLLNLVGAVGVEERGGKSTARISRDLARQFCEKVTLDGTVVSASILSET
jgi:hypothetical protein